MSDRTPLEEIELLQREVGQALCKRDEARSELVERLRQLTDCQRERDAARADVGVLVSQRDEAVATAERHNQRCIELLEEKLALQEDLRKCQHYLGRSANDLKECTEHLVQMTRERDEARAVARKWIRREVSLTEWITLVGEHSWLHKEKTDASEKTSE